MGGEIPQLKPVNMNRPRLAPPGKIIELKTFKFKYFIKNFIRQINFEWTIK